jgi:hypothetical protein
MSCDHEFYAASRPAGCPLCNHSHPNWLQQI